MREKGKDLRCACGLAIAEVVLEPEIAGNFKIYEAFWYFRVLFAREGNKARKVMQLPDSQGDGCPINRAVGRTGR